MTDKENLFCKYYTSKAAFNGTKAAILAGYSESSARQIASNKLSKHYIQEEIQSLTQSSLSNFEVTKERLIQELTEIAFCDLTQFMDGELEGKNLKGIKRIAKRKESLLIQAHDKLSALIMLGKLLGYV